MLLLFDWYESPDSQNNPTGEKKLYPRVCLRHRCSTDELCQDIESMTTASRGNILLALSALSHVVGKRMHMYKTMKGWAAKGRWTMGCFYGFKLHLVINDKGEIIQWMLIPGNKSRKSRRT